MFLLLSSVSGCGTENPAGSFGAMLADMEQRVGGSIGVYALDTETGATLAYRADERFAMASTFKPLLAAAILSLVDAGELNFEHEVSLEGVVVQPYSPVVGEVAAGQSMTLAELCEAAVSAGDNTAANVLLDYVGGPDGLTEFFRQINDETTRLDRYETELNSNLPGDVRDSTTPGAMVRSLHRVLFSDVLSDLSAGRLRSWMIASRTGTKRLRAGLPPDWRAGDKTGTGMNGAVNNIAFAWPPERAPIVIAVYMSRSEADVATLGAMHAEIAALIAQRFQ